MGILMLNGNNYTGGVQQVYGKSSGNIATFDDGGDNKPLKSLKCAINPVQSGSGDPSPSNVRPISGWTGANVTRCGKNLVDVSNGVVDGNYYAPDGTTTHTSYVIVIPRRFIKNGTYKLSWKTGLSGAYMRINAVTKDGNFISRLITSDTSPQTLNISEDTYIQLAYDYSAVTPIRIYDVQIEDGSTVSDYHTYNGQTYPITWSEAGEVFGGYVDYERKKLVVNRAEYDITSTRNLSQNGEDIIAMSIPSEYKVNVIPQCECFEGIERGLSSGLAVNQCRLNGAMNFINFRFSANKTVEEWKAELANNPIQLILGLVEPIEFDLDEPVPTITTLLGNNNIWSDTGEIEECVYQRDLNIVINQFDERITALEQALNSSGTRSLSLSKSAVKEEETKEEITEEPKEEEQNEDKR